MPDQRTLPSPVERRAGSGVTVVHLPNSPEETWKLSVEGDAFPRIVLDVPGGQVLVGSGAAPPAALGGGGSGAPTNASYVTMAAESGLSNETVLANVHRRDVVANRGAFGNAGVLFAATDTLIGYRDSGVAWDPYFPVLDSGGKIAGAVLPAFGPGAVGPIGDATHVAAVTTDATGRVSALSSVAITGLAESAITNLVSDLALKAPLASPALTGVPTAPTAAPATNTTQLATTAFVLANGGTPALTSAHLFVGNGSNVATDVALSGDATLANTGALTLKNTGPGATGPSGSATVVPVVTIDAQGRVTALTTTTIAIPESAVTNLTTDLAAKQSTTLTSAHLLVGNGSNVATDVAVTGDVTISNAGVTAIGAGKVTNAMLAGSIDLTAKVTGLLPIANGGTNASSAASALSNLGGAPIASPTFTGTVTLAADPVSALQAATKQYVDNAFSNFPAKADVAYASTSALPANTYSNGTSGVGATLTGNANGPLVIDSVTILVGQVGQRVLVAGEATAANNGWYSITQQGVVAVSPYILTRVTDADQGAEIGSGYITSVIAPNTVTPGTANNGKVFISVAAADPFVVGTTNLTFSAIGAATTYSAGTGITLTGTTFSIDTSVTVDKTTAQTLTNKTLTAPVLSSPTGLVAADIPSLDASKITTGTMATARLGSGTANSTTFLRGDQTYAAPPTGIVSVAAATTDQTLTSSSTTLQNLTNLTFNLPGDGTSIYRVDALLIFNTANATMDGKIAFATLPSGAVSYLLGDSGSTSLGYAVNAPMAVGTTPVAIGAATTAAPFGTGTGLVAIEFIFIIVDGGTSGACQLQGAQNTSDAGAITLKKGSCLKITKVN